MFKYTHTSCWYKHSSSKNHENSNYPWYVISKLFHYSSEENKVCDSFQLVDIQRQRNLFSRRKTQSYMHRPFYASSPSFNNHSLLDRIPKLMLTSHKQGCRGWIPVFQIDPVRVWHDISMTFTNIWHFF